MISAKSHLQILCINYTDQSGLLGIIRTGELWATKVQYMNDSTGFAFSLNIARNVLETRLTQSDVSEDINLFKSILDYHLHRINMVNICVVSFCRHGDLLSQWRGYSGEGGGYSIGLSLAALSGLGKDCRVGRCIYDKSDQSQIINEITEEMLGYKSQFKSTVDSRTLGTAFETALMECGAFFKDIAFKDEDEWRLATKAQFYIDEKFCFRQGESMPRPYYILDIFKGSWKNKIDTIVVGPCPHPENSKSAVEGLLQRYSVTRDFLPLLTYGLNPAPQVQLSVIPYRSW
jgi:hypothetical protein